jgi:hypothetical protein
LAAAITIAAWPAGSFAATLVMGEVAQDGEAGPDGASCPANPQAVISLYRSDRTLIGKFQMPKTGVWVTSKTSGKTWCAVKWTLPNVPGGEGPYRWYDKPQKGEPSFTEQQLQASYEARSPVCGNRTAGNARRGGAARRQQLIVPVAGRPPGRGSSSGA